MLDRSRGEIKKDLNASLLIYTLRPFSLSSLDPDVKHERLKRMIHLFGKVKVTSFGRAAFSYSAIQQPFHILTSPGISIKIVSVIVKT